MIDGEANGICVVAGYPGAVPLECVKVQSSVDELEIFASLLLSKTQRRRRNSW